MSIANLKDSGNQGNNMPWQWKMLQGLQAIADATSAPLTCVEDSVTICNANIDAFTFTNILGVGESLNVNIANTIPLEVNINEANDSILIYGFDGTTNRKIKTDAAGSVSINDGGNSITVDGTVSLSAGTLSALENITVQNGPGVNAVNIQDGGNSITVDATALDIRPLTCTDVVSLCFNNAGTPTQVSDTNPLPVNAIVTVPNLTCEFDSVAICDFASGNSLVPNANGSVSSQTLDGTGNAITSSSFPLTSQQALDVNVVNNLDCSTDTVAICNGSGNALAIDPTGNINSNLYAQDAGTGLQQPVSLTALGTANALDVYLQGPRGVQANCDDAISTALCQTQEDILTDIKTAAQNGTGFLRTTGMIRPNNVSGNVNTEPGAANFYSVSVANVGTNDGTILGGVTIKSGEVLNFSADAVNNYFNSFAYNATGTEFIIIFVY